MPTQDFERWALNYAGCDGGDPGTAESPSTWVCGIEWGGHHSMEDLILHLASDVSPPCAGYDDWHLNLSYPFNRQLMKLFAVMEGWKLEDYSRFAELSRPFVAGSRGYFKTNLFPIAFAKTHPSLWNRDIAEVTGFPTKNDYVEWCRSHRFPAMRRWVQAARPRLVVCLGKTYRADFASAFLDPEGSYTVTQMDGHEIAHGLNADGSLVVSLPFMLNPHGLTRNTSIEAVGHHIAKLLSETGSLTSAP